MIAHPSQTKHHEWSDLKPYLRRNPDDFQDTDHSGYEFWLNKLNTQGNYINAEMVKAFITSIEYRQRFAP